MATLAKIGKYEILEKIGEGGFGVVYKGKDPFIKRLVAVKTCSSENESIQKRFFREAEIAGNLHHANVVTIHDFGVEGETPYLVQEFLTGEDLDVLISDPSHHLSLSTKVRYLRGIAEGLRYAHAQGVIHRDIKPSNIRILENDRVKVMDFGIAKLKDQESQLTQTGMALGTVAYMSPEQLKGEKVDHRVDIFSFGVLAYELLVGKRPFHAESVSTLFYQLLHENPAPITDPAVPKQLEAVVERCLAKTLDLRYKSFDEVLVDLETVQDLVGDDREAITDDPFSSDATAGFTRLAAKAARSIEAGNLTAAQQALDIARREYDRATFDREFGALATALETMRAGAARDAQVSGDLVDLRAEIAAIDSHLQAGRTDDAAVAFTALELRYPQHPDVAALRQRVSRTVSGVPVPPAPPPTGALPPDLGPPVTGQRIAPLAMAGAAAARQRAHTGPLVAAVAAVVLLGTVGAILLARALLSETGDRRGGEVDRVETTSDGSTESGVQGEATAQDATDADAAALDAATPPVPGDEPAGSDDTAATSADATTSSPPSADVRRSTSTPSGDRPASSAQTRSSQGQSPPSQTRPATTPGAATTSGSTSRPTAEPSSQPTTEPRADPPSQNADTGTRAQTPVTPPSGPEPSGFDMSRVKTESEIRSALAVYEAAWKSRDHNAINNVHPGAGVTRRDVRSYREISVEIGPCSSIAIDGNRATASCPVTLIKTPRSGSPEITRYTSVELVQQTGRWLIARLR